MVQLACMTLPYLQHPIDRAFEAIARAGYKHVVFGYYHEGKLIPDEEDPASWEVLKAKAESFGLRIPMLLSHEHFGVNQPWERGIRQMEIAMALGVKEINVLGTHSYYKFPDRPKPLAELEQENMQFLEKFKAVAEEAEKRDLVLSVKPHTGNSATARILKMTLDAIGSSHIKACYDPGNVDAYEGVDVMDGFEEIAKLSSSFVAKDHRGGKLVNDFPVPGEGDMPFLEMFRLLGKYNFDGPIVVEKLDSGGPLELAEMDRRIAQGRVNLERLIREAGLELE